MRKQRKRHHQSDKDLPEVPPKMTKLFVPPCEIISPMPQSKIDMKFRLMPLVKKWNEAVFKPPEEQIELLEKISHDALRLFADLPIPKMAFSDFSTVGKNGDHVTSLGAGDHGCVQLMKIKDTDQYVAMKKCNDVNGEENTRVLLREAVAMTMVDDSDLFPKLLGIVWDEGLPKALVMEFIGDATMSSPTFSLNMAISFSDDIAMPSLRWYQIAQDVVRAIQHLHSRQLVHCDLHTGNILLSPSHDSITGADILRAKVIDLGSATPVELQSKPRLLTREEAAHYPQMAPELLTAEPSGHDIKTDIYSVGYVIESIGDATGISVLKELAEVTKQNRLELDKVSHILEMLICFTKRELYCHMDL